jgi:membrane protein YfhO
VEVGYVGILPLILAAFAIVLRRDSRTRFFCLLALLGLALALGGYGIVHGWLYALAPGFGQLRVPARFIYLLDFGLAVLAALGFEAVVQPLTGVSRRRVRGLVSRLLCVSLLVALVSAGVALSILILGQGQDPTLFARIGNASNSILFFILLLACSAALLLLRSRNMLSVTVWSALALALILFDLFSLGAYIDIGLGDPTAAYRREDVINFLHTAGGIFRIDSRTDVQGSWMPDTAALSGLYDVNGDNPLVLSEWNSYWEALGGRDTPAYSWLNVRYVIAKQNTPLPANFKRALDGAGGISIYENTTALPHAWVSYTGQAQGNTLVVDSPASIAADQVQITGYGPNEIDLQVIAGQPGYLILSEVYYPGWTATVDGQLVEVLRANSLFRAVPVPAGSSQVRLTYDPLSFKLGLAISSLTFLILAGSTFLPHSPIKSWIRSSSAD